ncbi:HD domain-containing phosphohydrolase [Massilia sp. TS11]|uniref:HD domain-containing phosphohydrolase n=1 Tax=Massilia sp. TS11 TaxID=2908003 RepID=UPI001EDC0414|nr:HD domain-containing phosphohydrolase [Massilia sp. TS11]MCG2585043.1 HD domain-containing protein [Massilia sp. TS11]
MQPEPRPNTLLEAFHDSHVGMGLLGLDGRWLHTNPTLCAMLGRRVEELIGQPFHGIILPDELPEVQAHLADLVSGARAYYHMERRYRRRDASIGWAQLTTSVVRDEQGQPASLLVQALDISEQKRSQRALRTLSAVNSVLVHASDEAQLLQAVCRTVVEDGGYLMAWVGHPLEDTEQRVVPLAHYGDADGYLGSVRVSWGDNPFGNGPTGRAVRLGRVEINQDYLRNPNMAPWREQAEKHGYRASVALPLPVGAALPDTLTLYAAEADAFDSEEVKLLQMLTEDLGFGLAALRTRAERDRMIEEEQRHGEALRASLVDSLRAIAAMVEMRDPYTAGHEARVAQLAVAIGRELGLDAQRLQGLELAAIVHDVGKIRVPAEILNKPGRLDPIEYEMLKRHPESGYAILKDIAYPWPIARMVHEHHERLDGSGYPQGLRGEAILLESRILAVADVVEAMCSHRPYRAGLGSAAALDEIRRHRGQWFDADVVDACLRLFASGRYSL